MIALIQSFMSERLEEVHPRRDKVDVPKNMYINYILYANVGVIRYWIDNGLHQIPEYMAKRLTVLTMKGPFEAAGLNSRYDYEKQLSLCCLITINFDMIKVLFVRCFGGEKNEPYYKRAGRARCSSCKIVF